MSIGFWQVIIIAVVVVLLFGRGKISELMGDVAKGIKSFKKGLAEEDSAEPKTIEHDAASVAEPAEEKRKAG
jgi:sec-independent protein translocase protein TatA